MKKQVAATRADEAREAKHRKKIVAQADGDEQDCHMTEAKTLLNLSENRYVLKSMKHYFFEDKMKHSLYISQSERLFHRQSIELKECRSGRERIIR